MFSSYLSIVDTMRTKTGKYKSITEKHELMDGAFSVVRTNINGDVYQFFMWITDEKKVIRKSLKTTHLEDAKEKGKDMFLSILARKHEGKNYFGLTVEQGIEKFLNYKQMEVDSGAITQGRHSTIKTILKHFHNYICERKYDTDKSKGVYYAKVNLKDLHRRSCIKYFTWRQSKSPDVSPVTLKNEQSTINAMVKYLSDEGEMDYSYFDFPKLKLPNNRDSIRRATFTIDEYKKFVQELRSYSAKKNCRYEWEQHNKLMLRHFYLIAANTGLRTNELRHLKWSDVEFYGIAKGKEYVRISVRGETSKSNKDRTFITRGGEYFRRLRKISKFTKQDNYVIQTEEGKRFSKRILYGNHWDNIMNNIGISNWKQRKLQPYSLRHFYVTCRIQSGNNYSEVAQMVGNSVTQIEKTYYHVSEEKMLSDATKDFVMNEEFIEKV